MLPGLRILLMMVVLCAGFLVFGLGAASLLRTAHLRTTPESLASWRAQADVALAPADRAATLALLRVDPPPLLREPAPLAAPVPNDQPAAAAGSQPTGAATPADASQTAARPPTAALSETPAAAPDADTSVAAAQPEIPAVQTTDAGALSAPERAQEAHDKEPSGQPVLAEQPAQAAAAQEIATPPAEPATTSPAQAATAVPAMTEASAASAPQAATAAAPIPPQSDRPLRVAALPDGAATSAATVDPVKAAAEAKAKRARELRAQQRARARLRARRLAIARARAARLAQTNQTTATDTPGFNNGAFPMPGATPNTATPTTPARAPR